MLMRRCFAIVAVLATVTLATQAQEKPSLDGSWLLSYGGLPVTQQRLGILKIETEDGKPTVNVVAGSPQKGATPPTFSDLKIDGAKISFKIGLGPNKFTFEGTIDPKNPKKILGSFGDNDRVFRAALETTELKKLEQKDMFFSETPSPTMAEINDLRRASNAARAKARQEDDSDEKAKLLKEAADLQKVSDEKTPALYKELVKETDSPFALTAAEALLAQATKIKANADDVATWAKMIEADSKKYGARIEQTGIAKLASTIASQDGFADIAMTYAELAAKMPNMTSKNRVGTLKVLAMLQTKSGKTELAQKTETEIAKLDEQLDTEYNATVPPFKPKKYEGRTDKSANKVAVMELFTGTQCPPCVAADVGYDGLIKSYKPQDVILIQYHLHIPGPDPLTNADSVARSEYYNKVAKGAIGGTPSTLFNGKSLAGGGGGMANSEKKFNEYSEILNEKLEESTDIKLAGSLKRADDALTVTVDVTGMKEPKDTLKLRLLLLEDNIRYVGSNGVRFHHHVVRSLLGTGTGIAVKDMKDGKHIATQSVKALQADLKKYLDDYNATSPFPYPDRPLAIKGLTVVAIIQDDATGEILQAIQLEAGGA